MKKYDIDKMKNIENFNKINLEFEKEIKELISKVKLFNPKSKEEISLSEKEFKVIQNFEEAQDYAYTQFDNEEDGYTIWTDVREVNSSYIYKELFEIENYIELDDFIHDISKVDISLFAEYSDEVYEIQDDISADLTNCIMARLIMGKKHEFFEKILRIYLSGGWPCGWEGNWFNENEHEKGRIIVYYPKKDN